MNHYAYFLTLGVDLLIFLGGGALFEHFTDTPATEWYLVMLVITVCTDRARLAAKE